MRSSESPIWLAQPSPPSSSALLSLPKELLLAIISDVAISEAPAQLYPTSLIELSKCCRFLYHLVHYDPWRLLTLWPRAFEVRFDTGAIYRRRLHNGLDWQAVLERRCRALYRCRAFALNPTDETLLDTIDWEAIWDMISEHDALNIPHLHTYGATLVAGIAFQSGHLRDRAAYPVILPILSALVNYDFSLTRFFASDDPAHIVSPELSQFAYNFEADALITQHMPLRPFHSTWDSTAAPVIASSAFSPAVDPLASAVHLFFATFFARHPAPYQAIPFCIPIPLFSLHSTMFDAEYLRRYERSLFIASLEESRDGWDAKRRQEAPVSKKRASNVYADTGFASPSHFVSESKQIEGEWIGYYSFLDPDDESVADESERATDWFDGPMRLTLAIVPFDDPSPDDNNLWSSRWSASPSKKRRLDASSQTQFPACYLRTCPLTRFEGTGVDNLGSFTISGLIDDTEDGQVTWEKTYIESSETWEYCGRFTLPMGMCGRWGDEEYGGPWWMWKVSASEASATSLASSSTSMKL